MEILVPEENHLERIDKFISSCLEIDFSRTYIQRLIKNGDIKANNKIIKSNYKVKKNDNISLSFPLTENIELKVEDLPLNIVYEDDQILVINKQPNLVIHPSPGHYKGTLVNGLLFYYPKIALVGEKNRPGIVHRLDKNTSGLMVVAKTDESYQNLVAQFATRKVKKTYSAIVQGKVKEEHFIINYPLAKHKKYRHKMAVSKEGKEAITEIFLEKIWTLPTGSFSFLKVNLHTGRTHQIRAHLSYTGNSVVGDPLYSKKWKKHKVPFLLLASTSLEFFHPLSLKKIQFKIDLPNHFIKFIKRLEISPPA